MAVTFKLPPDLGEIREFCTIDTDFSYANGDYMLRSDIEDWLNQQGVKYECVQRTQNDGWFNRVYLHLKIYDETIALQFKLIWL
jgi:hypothetical protein